MKKHAVTAGLGAPVRLRSADLSHPDAGTASVTKKETAGHQVGATADIEIQQPDSARLVHSAPTMAHLIKGKVIYYAAFVALIFRGVA